jgi:predicted metal-dependent hydrolase
VSTDIEVRRSRRRRRTVSAYREDGRTIVLIPARFTKAEERQWVATMVERLERGDRRRRPSDAQLRSRAAELSGRYLGGLARPTSIRWVSNQQSRWGSCTPSDGTIRISDRVKGMPGYVLDYVVLHELAHLLAPGHGPDFWRLLAGYPRLERARGYLEGVAAAAGLELSDGEQPAGTPGGEVETAPAQAALEFGPAGD